MELFGLALFWGGIAAMACALLWSFVVVFKESPFVAVLCLFLPMGLPVALLLRWPRTWKPLAAWALSLALFFGGLSILRPGG